VEIKLAIKISFMSKRLRGNELVTAVMLLLRTPLTTLTPGRHQNLRSHSCFYPNVTKLRSGLCYRQSVCRLCRLSSVCRLSVTLVHPAQGIEAFSNNYFTSVYPGHRQTYVENFTEIVPGKPFVGGVKRNRGSKIKRWWAYRRLYLINGTR